MQRSFKGTLMSNSPDFTFSSHNNAKWDTIDDDQNTEDDGSDPNEDPRCPLAHQINARSKNQKRMFLLSNSLKKEQITGYSILLMGFQKRLCTNRIGYDTTYISPYSNLENYVPI